MAHATPARVLILVKASPQPSVKYGDTVCVAGLTMTATPQWIRLYPVPFRYLDGSKRFKKYDVIDVGTRDASPDKRPESRKINADSVKIISNIGDWSKRATWVEELPTPTMCDVAAQVRADLNSTSLAAVRPATIDGLDFEPHPGWSPEQRAKLEAYRAQEDLSAKPSPAP